MSEDVPNPSESSLFPDYVRVDRATLLVMNAVGGSFEDAWKIVRKELHTGSIAGSASVGFDLHPVPSREWLSMRNGVEAAKSGLFTFEVEHVISKHLGEGNLLRLARDLDQLPDGVRRGRMRLRAYLRDDDLSALMVRLQVPARDVAPLASSYALGNRTCPVHDEVKARMRAALADGVNVFAMKQKELAYRFNNGRRTVCVEVLKELKAEMSADNERQTTNSDMRPVRF